MPEFIGMSLVGALASSFVSGWVAGRLARGAEVANALAVGVVVVLYSACLFMPLQMNAYPLWYNVPAFLLAVPLTLAGGLFVRRSRVA
ncbi:hypothetical protein EEB15_29275 [Ramlibacter sp. WS9]|nr:hypothetical protein EEB15_29275 [Ramlibacter sp. WS9]